MSILHMVAARGPLALTKVLAIPGAAAVLSGCSGYVPGAKAYWDGKVKEMCEKDGGVTIYEKLLLSKEEMNLLPRAGSYIDVPIKKAAKPNAPAYAEMAVTRVHAGNPQVTRTEGTIVRRTNQAVVARWVIYERAGGDFPSPSYGSSFRCPTLKQIDVSLQSLFELRGSAK